MDWLIAVKKDSSGEELDTLLRDWGCERDEETPPTPMDGDEDVIAVSGPRDLAARAKGDPRIRGVYPNSELTLY